MGCVTCGNTVTATRHQRRPPSVIENPGPCNITEQEIRDLYPRVLCYKQKQEKVQLSNKYLGLLLTMLNLNSYCLYDLQEIYKAVEDEDC